MPGQRQRGHRPTAPLLDAEAEFLNA